VPQEPPADLRLPPADLRIVSVGRMTPEKRPQAVVQAFAGLGRRDGVQLVMVGAGPKLEECRRLAESLGVGDRVVFTGLQSQRTVAALLQAGDVFVIASRGFDNQPMVILEAASAGLPIVYCDPGADRGPDAGELAARRQRRPGRLAAAFESLVRDATLRKSMAKASLEVSEAFDAGTVRHRLVAVYERALALHAARA
jgi:glycosyltransferase involved in cell wall biosynthesis